MFTKIEIPTRTHQDFGDSILKLINIISKMDSVQENIILDFSQAKMLNPFFLGGITCFIQHLQSIGKTVTLNHEGNPNINSYLSTIHFPETYSASKTSQEEYSEAFKKYYTKTYVPIISFKTGESEQHTSVRESVLSGISSLIKNQLAFKEKERQPISYFLDEMTNNINDHSGAVNGYVFAQFYPSSNYLDICICDSGKGIYKSYIDDIRFDPINEIDAMKMALYGKSTKNRSEARGFGISTTRQMLVNGLKGKFFLWSGNTTFTHTLDREAILALDKNQKFQGTFVALRLPTLIPSDFDFYKYVDK